MLGRKLAERLARDGAIGVTPVAELTLADVVEPAVPAGAAFAVQTRVADVSVPGVADDLVASRPDVVFHLAAIPSGGAEADFDGGYRVNLDGVRLLLEAIRAAGLRLRAAGRLLVDHRGVRRAVPGGHPRRLPPHAADLLRQPEGDGRAAAERLHAPRAGRRRRHPPADRLRAARHAERGRLGLLLEHHPRAAERARGRAAGRRRRAPRLRRRRARRSTTSCTPRASTAASWAIAAA